MLKDTRRDDLIAAIKGTIAGRMTPRYRHGGRGRAAGLSFSRPEARSGKSCQKTANSPQPGAGCPAPDGAGHDDPEIAGGPRLAPGTIRQTMSALSWPSSASRTRTRAAVADRPARAGQGCLGNPFIMERRSGAHRDAENAEEHHRREQQWNPRVLAIVGRDRRRAEPGRQRR